MKVKELFERFGGSNSFPVSVEYELEYTTPEGDVDYKTLEITGEVLVTSDAYGTGDSPTDYEFNVDEIIDQETGQKLSDTAIPQDAWEGIENQAIEKVNRHR
jgi:hypothetical protein